MMDTIIYIVLTLAYLILFLFGIRIAMNHSWLSIGNVVLLVILALAYDNLILALGKFIGEGELLRILNVIRYWLHALITPLLVLTAWDFLLRADVKWAKAKIVSWLVLAITLGLIIIEITTVVWDITLKPTWDYGILSYEKAGNGNPIMIIGVSLSLLITSIIIWWKQKWPWLFVGVLVMSFVPVLHFLHTSTLSNIGELLLMIALLATKNYQNKRDVGSNQ